MSREDVYFCDNHGDCCNQFGPHVNQRRVEAARAEAPQGEASRRRPRRVVVWLSGGVTSAWCAGWAKRTFPPDEIVMCWHDTKEEDADTYRYLRELVPALGLAFVERSDGRSVTQLFRDEGFLGNNQNAMCSRILKREQGDRFVAELQAAGYDIVCIFGFSANEPKRVERAVGRGLARGFSCRFPVVEEKVSKQDCVDWSLSIGVNPPSMYCWSEHANCVGCVKGGMAYWLKVAEHRPDVFAQRMALEEEFGHGILRGGDRDHVLLKDLVKRGLKRSVNQREKIDIGACDCGD
jgi:hypothetical protein